jgi:hypothetical protein
MCHLFTARICSASFRAVIRASSWRSVMCE